MSYLQTVEEQTTYKSPSIANEENFGSTKYDYVGPSNIFHANDCSLINIIVHEDKAIVCRSLKLQLRENCTSLIILKRLPIFVDTESFRVEVIQSDLSKINKKSPIIRDVKYKTNAIVDDSLEWFKIRDDLNQQIRSESRRKEMLTGKVARMQKQKEMLEYFADTVVKPTKEHDHAALHTAIGHAHRDASQIRQPASQAQKKSSKSSCCHSKGRSKSAFPEATISDAKCIQMENCSPTFLHGFQPKSVEAMSHFFSLYDKNADQLDSNYLETVNDLETCENRIQELKAKLDRTEHHYESRVSKELHITLQTMNHTQSELKITYVVKGVSWQPSYDIRYSTNDGKVKLSYYGVIQQSTGEDWTCDNIVISNTKEIANTRNLPQLSKEKLLYKHSKDDNAVRTRQKDKKSNRMMKALSFHSYESPLTGEFCLSEDDEIVAQNQADPLVYSNLNLQSMKSSCSKQHSHVSRDHSHDLMYVGRTTRRFLKRRNERLKVRTYIDEDEEAKEEVTDKEDTSKILNYLLTRSEYCPRLSGIPAYGSNFDLMPMSATSTLTKKPQTQRDKRWAEATASCSRRPRLRQSVVPSEASTMVQSMTNSCLPTECHQGMMSDCNSTLCFNVSDKVPSILGDNEPERVLFGDFDLEATIQRQSIPKRIANVFLLACLINNTDHTLLQGAANVYIDGAFTGTVNVPRTNINSSFDCNLGPDPSVKISYQCTEEKAVKSKSHVISHKKQMKIKNTSDRFVKILLLDQVPVSGEDKIKVLIMEPTIKNPEKYDKTKPVRMTKQGIIEWDLDFEPEEEKIVNLRYNVEHPNTQECFIIESN